MRTAGSPLLRIPLLILMLLGTGAAWGNDLERLVQLSGLADQVALVPDQVRRDMTRQLDAMPGAVPESLEGSVERVVGEALAPDAIIGGITARLEDSVDQATVARLMRWYRSDLGRRIAAAEVLASSPQAYQPVMSSIEALLADSGRADTARAINQLHNGTEKAIQVMEVTQLAMVSVAMEAGSPDLPYDRNSLRDTVRTALDAARPEIERYLLATCVYAYRDLSDKELDAYRTFLSRPETRRFNDALADAVMAEWERAFGIMAQRFVGALTAHRAELGSA